jgi:hypothetical protein
MGQVREGEMCLIRNNVLEDEDVGGGEIKTLIAFVISGVYKENTSGGFGCSYLSDFGGEIGIAGTNTRKCSYERVIPWRETYQLVTLIALVGRRFSRYVVVWSPFTQW